MNLDQMLIAVLGFLGVLLAPLMPSIYRDLKVWLRRRRLPKGRGA
jgi:hypothetical protein